jgi:hypothetical protein
MLCAEMLEKILHDRGRHSPSLLVSGKWGQANFVEIVVRLANSEGQE